MSCDITKPTKVVLLWGGSNELDSVTIDYMYMYWQTCTLVNAYSILHFTAVSRPFFTTNYACFTQFIFSHSTNVRRCVLPVKTSFKSVKNRLTGLPLYTCTVLFANLETGGTEKWYDTIHTCCKSVLFKLFMNIYNTQFHHKITHAVYKWAAIWQNQQSECAPSEDSDQTGHRCPHEETLGP